MEFWMKTKNLAHKLGGFTVGINPATPVAPNEIVNLIGGTTEGASAILSGRGAVTRAVLPGIGSVVVKQYLRGGLLSMLGSLHLRRGISRPELEMKALIEVRNGGVNAPEPIAWITKGSLFYRGWLVLREMPGVNLAELSLRDEQAAIHAIPAVVREVGKLVERGVYHIDFHPGNVLVDPDGVATILDFDRAVLDYRPSDLSERYLRRWRRAIIKHGLSESLMEHFSLGIRSKGALSGF
jgi:3-deoxy-D-manno-octulosonic acid kinase